MVLLSQDDCVWACEDRNPRYWDLLVQSSVKSILQSRNVGHQRGAFHDVQPTSSSPIKTSSAQMDTEYTSTKEFLALLYPLGWDPVGTWMHIPPAAKRERSRLKALQQRFAMRTLLIHSNMNSASAKLSRGDFFYRKFARLTLETCSVRKNSCLSEYGSDRCSSGLCNFQVHNPILALHPSLSFDARGYFCRSKMSYD